MQSAETKPSGGWQTITSVLVIIFSLLIGFSVFNIVLYLGSDTSNKFTSEVIQIAPESEYSDDINELRKNTEDLALEQLRIDLRAQMRNPVKGSPEEELAEEDEEMSTIFEIVRLAQERFSTEERLSQHQVNLTYVSDEGFILPTLSGATCALSEDCARTCDEECEGLAGRQQCNQECQGLCGPPCKGRASGEVGQCEATCVEGCQATCLSSKGDALLRRRDVCQDKVRQACRQECRGTTGSARRATETICYQRCTASNLTACNIAMNPSCFANCGRHLCVDGQCRCPIYSQGDPTCSKPLDISEHLPKRYADCAATLSNSKFNTKADAKRGRNVSHTFLNLHHLPTLEAASKERHNAHGVNKRIGRVDLDLMADFSTCAVVGSSNSMIGKNLGGEIDDHTAVIRFNDAPTQGNSCEREKLAWWRECRFLRLSDRMLSYVRLMFRDPKASFLNDKRLMDPLSRGRHKEVNRDTSAGFFGLSLALHLCGKVDIYGFSQGSGHYFRKIDRSRGQRKFAAKHPWALEKQCVSVVSSLQGVQKVN